MVPTMPPPGCSSSSASRPRRAAGLPVHQPERARSGQLQNYDRAPFLLPPELERRFYRAYGRLAELAFDRSRRATVALTPGDILVFDNWRVLHGRNGFSGHRHYLGAYLNHEDLESKRRLLRAR